LGFRSRDVAGERGRIYERLNRGDVEGIVELCDDDFLMDMSERVFNPDTYRGMMGFRRFYSGVQDAWESYRWGVEETRIAAKGLAAGRWRADPGQDPCRVTTPEICGCMVVRERSAVEIPIFRRRFE
jgi:hypothetical protein